MEIKKKTKTPETKDTDKKEYRGNATVDNKQVNNLLKLYHSTVNNDLGGKKTTIKVSTSGTVRNKKTGKTIAKNVEMKKNVDSRNIVASHNKKRTTNKGTDLTKASTNSKQLNSGTTASLYKKNLPYSRLQTAKQIKANEAEKEKKREKKKTEQLVPYYNKVNKKTHSATFETSDNYVKRNKKYPERFIEYGDTLVVNGKGNGTKRAVANKAGLPKGKVKTLEDIANWQSKNKRARGKGPADIETVIENGGHVTTGARINEQAKPRKEEIHKNNLWQQYSKEQKKREEMLRATNATRKRKYTEEEIQKRAMAGNTKKEGVWTKTPTAQPAKKETPTTTNTLPKDVDFKKLGDWAKAYNKKQAEESKENAEEWRRKHPPLEEKSPSATKKSTTTKAPKETKKTNYTDEEILKALGVSNTKKSTPKKPTSTSKKGGKKK